MLMEALRQTNQQGKAASGGQGLAALLVMAAVLLFILVYCCWGAPCCRALCRRRCCCRGDLEAAPSVALSVDRGVVSTPTIILLPYGRMLVVDGSVFAQLQAESTGLDLIELGENVVRAQQRREAFTPALSLSTPSILDVDSETTSKDGWISPIQGNPPPAYESLFGSGDLPPSYEEIIRQLHQVDQMLLERGIELSTVNYESEGSNCPVSENVEEENTRNQENTLHLGTAEDFSPEEEDYESGEIRESRV